MAAARAVLELLRIGLLPSAWADTAAGACLAGAAEPLPLAGALLLSSGMYLFGMASNAVADRADCLTCHADKAEHYNEEKAACASCHEFAKAS